MDIFASLELGEYVAQDAKYFDILSVPGTITTYIQLFFT